MPFVYLEGRVVSLHISPDLVCTTRVRLIDESHTAHELLMYNHEETIAIAKGRGMAHKLKDSGVYGKRKWKRLVTELAEAYKADTIVRVQIVENKVNRVDPIC